MSEIRSVCVYCGSRNGVNPNFREGAEKLGELLAQANIRLVYGGGSVGLMGAVADAALRNGGRVTGIIPQFLADREVMHKGVTDLIITADMHERKRLMFEEAESFVALPGGIGTLEELVEMLTWAQLGQHKKPVLLANFGGYWDSLLDLISHMKSEDFVSDANGFALLQAREPEEIVPTLNAAAARIAREELEQDSETGVIARM